MADSSNAAGRAVRDRFMSICLIASRDMLRNGRIINFRGMTVGEGLRSFVGESDGCQGWLWLHMQEGRKFMAGRVPAASISHLPRRRPGTFSTDIPAYNDIQPEIRGQAGAMQECASRTPDSLSEPASEKFRCEVCCRRLCFGSQGGRRHATVPRPLNSDLHHPSDAPRQIITHQSLDASAYSDYGFPNEEEGP